MCVDLHGNMYFVIMCFRVQSHVNFVGGSSVFQGQGDEEELMPVKPLPCTPYRSASICSEIRTSIVSLNIFRRTVGKVVSNDSKSHIECHNYAVSVNILILT